ncbi:hypothetical protein SynA1825c_01454 [Synechococcus sp. A18-25c]|nr:hypothetical protein SynA1560_01465 [Synechococcus sp. A15-60]QNJ19760.1 hypothetical protein SynA1825c_01454 [Synechococcus sp. A18-25c]
MANSIGTCNQHCLNPYWFNILEVWPFDGFDAPFSRVQSRLDRS